MTEFLKAMEKLIKERFPGIKIEHYHNYAGLQMDLTHESTRTGTDYICICNNHVFAYQWWHEYDIANPEFDPEQIIKEELII